MSSATCSHIRTRLLVGLLLAASFTTPAHAFFVSSSNTDFNTPTAYSNVTTFSFSIEISEPLQTGVYSNPTNIGIDYSVSGSLVSGTPSTFSAFALHRPEPGAPAITGSEFYDQGSSLQFEIAAGADLTDGVQITDLAELDDFALPSLLIEPDPLLSTVTGTSSSPVFVFNGREIQDITGRSRFHPALLVLYSDGTGSLRNSNNIVNKNGFTEIPFGSEYITNLTFNPVTTTLIAAVPVPAAAWLFCSGLLVLTGISRRKTQT